MTSSPSINWPPAWINVKTDAISSSDGNAIDKSEFQNSIQLPSRTPKLFKSFITAQSLQEWNISNLSNVLFGKSVEVYVSTSGNFPGGHGSIYDNKERARVTMKADEAMQRIQRSSAQPPVLGPNERYYIYQSDSKPFDALLARLPKSPAQLVQDGTATFSNMWISSADSLTPAHYDKADNLFLQLEGRKSFLIWDPSQLPYLALQSETADQDRQTTINMRDSNSVQSHIDFSKKASAFHCVLNPGDLLYLPEGWIHAVYSLDNSASVNYWWNQHTLRQNFASIGELALQTAVADTDPAPINNLSELSLDVSFSFEDIYGKFNSTGVAPIPVPSDVILAKSFNNRDNNMRRNRFQTNESEIIACQACGNKQHECGQCPYLGHYQYKRISGQVCDYNQYELLEPKKLANPVVDAPKTVLQPSPLGRFNQWKSTNVEPIPVPEGVYLANEFATQKPPRIETDCKACHSQAHTYSQCPYLGHYECNIVAGQIGSWGTYRLKSPISHPKPSTKVAIAPTKPRPGNMVMTKINYDDYKYESTNLLRANIPPGLVLAPKFDTRANSQNFDFGFDGQSTEVKVPCQACASKEHEYHRCPYLGYYKYTEISGQSCDYKMYKLDN